MDLIKLTHENIESEHICCAVASNKDEQVLSKKNWLKERLDEGLVFVKCDVRGKCFIEYIPCEYAWAPINGDGYIYIDCLWVSGQLKGHGYSTLLLDECIRDGKEKCKKGLIALSAKKKLGFLADPKYLIYKGFKLADTSNPYFALYYLPFDNTAEAPKFKDCVKEPLPGDRASGFTLYYTNQCPFTARYVPLLAQTALAHNVPLNTVHIATMEQARQAPTPFTTFTLFYNSEFITHEILSEKKFEAILASKGY